jgi:hypothetical protein
MLLIVAVLVSEANEISLSFFALIAKFILPTPYLAAT